MWYTFYQNNSHGRLEGPAEFVCVEGDNVDEINSRATSLGLYFDGEGDCLCCGDRWTPAWGNLDNEPLVYGKPPVELDRYWKGSSVLIVPVKGRKKWINKPK